MKTFSLPSTPETLESGHAACAGCGMMPALRLIQRALGPNMVASVPACCLSVVNGQYPNSAMGIPVVNCAFETAAVSAAGLRAGFEVLGIDDAVVVAIAGDGGTFDIGFGALSAAAERNDDFIYICYDNEAYMNTGIQRSSATPMGAWTTTTPSGALKTQPKKDLGAIMAAHRIPYFATASMAFPEDFARKLRAAKSLRGFRLIHYLCPCPTGWQSDPRLTIKLSRLAVQSRVFPLYETFDGERWSVQSSETSNSSGAFQEYLELQGRFRYLTAGEKEQIKRVVDRRWTDLLKRSSGQ